MILAVRFSRVPSMMEQWRASRLTAAGDRGGNRHEGHEVPAITQKPLLNQELTSERYTDDIRRKVPPGTIHDRAAASLQIFPAVSYRGGNRHVGRKVPAVIQKAFLNKEITGYLTEEVQLDAPHFSLPGCCLRKSSPTNAEGMREVVAAANIPHLALLARLFHGVETTS